MEKHAREEGRRRSPTPKYLSHRRRKNNRHGRRPLLFFFLGSPKAARDECTTGGGEERKKDLGVERKSVIYKTEKGRKKPLRKYLFLRFERERDCGGMSESTCLYVVL